jgi:putative heme transporter
MSVTPENSQQRDQLKRFNHIVLAVVLVFGVMYFARQFLVPLVLSVLVATLMVPFCRWLERRGITRGWAATISATSVFLVLGSLVLFIAWQVSSFAEDLPELKDQLGKHVSSAQGYLRSTFGIVVEDLPASASDTTSVEQQGRVGAAGEARSATLPGAGEEAHAEEAEDENAIPMATAVEHLFTFAKVGFGTLFTIMIIFAYIVLFLYYRTRLRDAVVMIFPEHRKERTKHALREAGSVGQSYLGGMFIVTTILGVLNSLALLLIGIDHPFLFGFLAGYLNFIPFVGTMVGSLLPITMALLTEDSVVPAVLVAGAFTFNQVLEETLLTPRIVGNKVNVNPLFIIFAIVIGNMVWGIAGVVLFIPLMAIAKIIFDHVEELRPLAHFLGQQEDEEPTLFRRLRDKWRKARA